jgi:hypothetical protein
MKRRLKHSVRTSQETHCARISKTISLCVTTRSDGRVVETEIFMRLVTTRSDGRVVETEIFMRLVSTRSDGEVFDTAATVDWCEAICVSGAPTQSFHSATTSSQLLPPASYCFALSLRPRQFLDMQTVEQ